MKTRLFGRFSCLFGFMPVLLVDLPDNCYNIRMNILRPVTENDLLLLYEWANDETTRRMSFRSEPIDLETHTRWFRKKLADNSCYFYILEHDGTPAGTGRLDREHAPGVIYSISYSIAPAFRGLGLGEVLLDLLFSEAKNAIPDAEALTGEVKKENAASIRCFEKAGFSLADTRPDSFLYKKSI